jgi:hypothetical protein
MSALSPEMDILAAIARNVQCLHRCIDVSVWAEGRAGSGCDVLNVRALAVRNGAGQAGAEGDSHG